MSHIADILIAIIAALHAGFLILEMGLWETTFGRRIFGLTPEFAEQSARLAANQGLYNGFLAAGLVWGLLATTNGLAVKTFFLACVAVAGMFGGITVKRSILVIQALPAVAALVLLYWP